MFLQNTPTPTFEKTVGTRRRKTHRMTYENDETKRRCIEGKSNIKLKRKEIVRQPSDRATSRPRALERSGDKKGGEREMGGGSGTNNGKHTSTRILQSTI